jgi:hypothetical protein
LAQTVAFGPAVFTGTGLNDATSGGRFTSAPSSLPTVNAQYVVIISSTGAPDSFRWSKDGGSLSFPVGITGGAQVITDGLTVTFAATTGHTLNDSWTITATAAGSVPGSGFTQPLTGSKLRTVGDKEKDVVSVRDFAGNDTEALQTAVNALAPTGGMILIPEGNYSLCSVTVRSYRPITIFGYGAVIRPSCPNQYVFNVLGNLNRILGLMFIGTAGTNYEGIRFLNDATTPHTEYGLVRDVYMQNMYRGILYYMDTVAAPEGATYRQQVEDTVIENFYLQKTWPGSFGISFDGNANGNAGGNDSRVHGGGVKGYQSNIIVRNSTATRISNMFIDGGGNGVLYDAGDHLELEHVYMEYNTYQVTLQNNPYQLSIYGGTMANQTACINGTLYGGFAPLYVGEPGCVPANDGLTSSTNTGDSTMTAANSAGLGTNGGGETNTVSVHANGGSDYVADFSGVRSTRSLTLYRSNGPIYMTARNVALSGNSFIFGDATGTNIQFPRTPGVGGALHSNGGFSKNYNGMWVASNEVANGSPANASLPSWALDLGGFDAISYPGSADQFRLLRRSAGAFFAEFLSVSNTNYWTFANGFRLESSGGAVPGNEKFSSLGASANGAMYYCSDCRNVQDDAAVAGAACVSGGSGAIARRENNEWHCN